MTSTASPAPAWRDRLDDLIGKAQLDALQWTLRTAAGLRPGVCEVAGGVRVPFLHRRGDGGVPAAMIHGFGGNKETWLLMATFLSRGRGLLLIDLPGHGGADDIAEDEASTGAQARAVRAVLDHLDLERADLVGNSMGGGVSLRLARDQPQRVRSLTLICSVGPDVEESELGAALARGENLLIPTAKTDHDAFLKLVAERLPPMPRPMQRRVTRERVAAGPRLQRIFRGWQRARGGEALPDDLGAITVPALVIHGARDRIIHPATGRALAAGLPRSELVLLDGVGHVPQLEQPRQLARRVEAFLGRLD